MLAILFTLMISFQINGRNTDREKRNEENRKQRAIIPRINRNCLKRSVLYIAEASVLVLRETLSKI